VPSARGLDTVIQEIMRVVSPQPSRDVESRREVSIFVEKHAFQEKLKRPTTLITVTDSDFEETLKKHDAVVVYFWAVWCMPCKMIAPHVGALAKKMAGNVVFGKLNVDENPRTTIYGVPKTHI
jgi:thioredoxin-like negative regulator of GroEL